MYPNFNSVASEYTGENLPTCVYDQYPWPKNDWIAIAFDASWWQTFERAHGDAAMLRRVQFAFASTTVHELAHAV